MLRISEADQSAIDTVRRNADMLVEITAWAVGYRDCGFEVVAAMKNIVLSLEREGYMRKATGKRKSTL